MATSGNSVIAENVGPGRNVQQAQELDIWADRANSNELRDMLLQSRNELVDTAIREDERVIKLVIQQEDIVEPAIRVFIVDLVTSNGSRKMTFTSREQLGAFVNGIKAVCELFDIYLPEPQIP